MLSRLDSIASANSGLEKRLDLMIKSVESMDVVREEEAKARAKLEAKLTRRTKEVSKLKTELRAVKSENQELALTNLKIAAENKELASTSLRIAEDNEKLARLNLSIKEENEDLTLMTLEAKRESEGLLIMNSQLEEEKQELVLENQQLTTTNLLVRSKRAIPCWRFLTTGITAKKKRCVGCGADALQTRVRSSIPLCSPPFRLQCPLITYQYQPVIRGGGAVDGQGRGERDGDHPRPRFPHRTANGRRSASRRGRGGSGGLFGLHGHAEGRGARAPSLGLLQLGGPPQEPEGRILEGRILNIL